MAALCSTPLNELVMVQAITEWTLVFGGEAETSLDIARVRWKPDRWERQKEEKEPRERERE